MNERPTYPWDKWLDGNEHQLKRGVDYRSHESVMASAFYRRAYRIGKAGRVSKGEGWMRVQAVDDLPRIRGRAGLGRPNKYPWELWLNGEPHTLLKGRDFECNVPAMRSCLYSGAGKRKLCIVTNAIPGGLRIQAFKDPRDEG